MIFVLNVGIIIKMDVEDMTEEQLKEQLQIMAIELNARDFDVEQYLKDLFQW